MYKKLFIALIVLIGMSKAGVFAAPGDLDTTFNAGGIQPGTVSTTIDNNILFNVGTAVAIQPDGKIVVAGFTIINNQVRNKFAVARFNTDGTLDTTFNAGGVQPGTVSTTIDNVNVDNQCSAVAIQQDGKIVLAGTAKIAGIYRFAAARFNTNGTLDTTTFNAGGPQPGTVTTTIDSSVNFSAAASVAFQQDGKIVLAGTSDIGTLTQKLAVARFNTNGTLDTTFNIGGVQQGTVTTSIDNGVTSLGQSVVLQPDGKIVVAGATDITGSSANKFAVARFLSTGSFAGTLDTTFNAAGVQPGTVSTTIDGSVVYNQGNSVALQQDGKIVVAGYATISGINEFAAARFTTNGIIDTTFNAAGVQPGTVSTTIDGVAIDNQGGSVALQQDGKIVIAGWVQLGGSYQFGVARFKTNGILDTTFIATPPGVQPGTVSTTIDNSVSVTIGRSVAIQTDGKIVVAGDVDSSLRFAVARFNGGSVETTNLCALRLIEKYGPIL